jgi:hypothetical protein
MIFQKFDKMKNNSTYAEMVKVLRYWNVLGMDISTKLNNNTCFEKGFLLINKQ